MTKFATQNDCIKESCMVPSRHCQFEHTAQYVWQDMRYTTRVRFLAQVQFLLLLITFERILRKVSLYQKGKTAGA